MQFELVFSKEAAQQLRNLEFDEEMRDLVKLRKVRKCLGYLQSNPKHPSLETHAFESLTGRNGEKVFEAYVENNVSAAWRVFWHYLSNKGMITVVAVTLHP